MFKLDMNAIRQSANDTWLMANTANVANLANESGKNGAEISQQPPKLAGIAKLAISQQPICTLQADPQAPALDSPASTQPPDLVQPPAPSPNKTAKPRKQTFMEWRDGWIELDRAYQAHHFNCPTCKAAGLGYGLRCGTGAALWTSYSSASS